VFSPLYGALLALPTSLPGTNAQAYYEKAQLTAVKSFIALAPAIKVVAESANRVVFLLLLQLPVVNVNKLFFSVTASLKK
jgi:hypothetical protein